MTSIQSGFANLTAHQRPTVGDLKMSAVTVDHLGWLYCDGRSLSTSDFLFLFNAIGYQFGGSGSNFNLPNPGGQVVGVAGTFTDTASNTSNFALGDQTGEYLHTLTIAEIPSHNHDIPYTSSNTWVVGTSSLTGIAGSHTHSTNVNAPSIGLAQRTGANTFTTSDSSPGELDLVNAGALILSNAGNHQHTIWAEGGSEKHNNVQPTITMGNMFIYSGRPTYPTLFNQSYNGWPAFYQGSNGYPNPPLQ